MDEVLDSVDIVIMEGMNRDLQWPFIGEEVRKACFQMHPSKSPGSDGMSL